MVYAIVTNGMCTNIIEADTDFAVSIGAVELPTGYGIGDGYDGQVWTKAEPVAEDPPVDRVAAMEGRVADLLGELTAVQTELAALKGG